MSEVRHCEYCGNDFETESEGKGAAAQRFCRARACKRDRRAESVERYYAKVPKKAGYNRADGLDPTMIGSRPHLRCRRRRRQEEA